MLEIRDLTVAYGDLVALRQVSLSLSEGEMLGVVGPNGSGKSTLIRAITRVVRPRSGAIRLDGRDATRLSQRELAQRVAVVPQNPYLPDAFTALEVALMGRTPHLGLLQSEGRADLAAVRRALEQTDTWHLATRRAGELSGGERQRVVVARALAQEAPILLLDEPTAHLDVGHQATVLDLVRRLCRESGADTRPRAVLAVVHDLTLAAQYCDRLVMLNDGRVAAEGKPYEVLSPEILASVYGTRVWVFPHPLTGRPVVTPMSETFRPAPTKSGW
ncbi:MAG: ABC transporter ATP-binding protein [Chloroflexota bacterium]|nr:ABC transporter ATP-binding protein [Chloroflexota bacterium]